MTVERPAGPGAPAGQVADFVDRFARAWADPSSERFAELLHPDVMLIQPIGPVVHGRAEADAFFRRLIALIPDLRGEVLSWGHRDDAVFIELRLHGTLGGRRVEWITLDRIQLDAGTVRRRVAYFSPLPLLRAVALRPWALLGLARRRGR